MSGSVGNNPYRASGVVASLAAASYYVVIKTDDFSIQKKIIIQ